MFVIGFAFGFFRLNELSESDTMKLYVPQTSRGFDGQDYFDATFGTTTSDFYIMFQTKDSTKSVVSTDVLVEIFDAETKIREFEKHETKYSGIFHIIYRYMCKN